MPPELEASVPGRTSGPRVRTLLVGAGAERSASSTTFGRCSASAGGGVNIEKSAHIKSFKVRSLQRPVRGVGCGLVGGGVPPGHPTPCNARAANPDLEILHFSNEKGELPLIGAAELLHALSR